MEMIKITEEETDISNQEARYIYGYLRKKYCNDSVHDLDVVLNSLCFSLLRMIHMHVEPRDRMAMVGIINQILQNGIQKD